MRAALFVGVDQDLSVEDVNWLPPGPRDVVVQVAASGVCHSDQSVIDGKFPSPPPTVLGHEGSGTAEWVGSEVSRCAPASA